MSSSSRPSKRPSRANAIAKGAIASRSTARRPRPYSKKSPRAPAAAPSRPPAPPARQAIRLARSASSRLTIKPGVAGAPRPQLELSTRLWPGGPRRLSEVELDEDEVLIDGFDATLDGVKVRITAVLERTCVYVGWEGDRRLARKIDIWVEANKLPIRRRSQG